MLAVNILRGNITENIKIIICTETWWLMSGIGDCKMINWKKEIVCITLNERGNIAPFSVSKTRWLLEQSSHSSVGGDIEQVGSVTSQQRGHETSRQLSVSGYAQQPRNTQVSWIQVVYRFNCIWPGPACDPGLAPSESQILWRLFNVAWCRQESSFHCVFSPCCCKGQMILNHIT